MASSIGDLSSRSSSVRSRAVPARLVTAVGIEMREEGSRSVSNDIWVAIKGFPDYVMTREGEVFNIKLKRQVQHHWKGYLYVDLMRDGKQHSRAVRVLIRENFGEV